jgi:hypothetical protein
MVTLRVLEGSHLLRAVVYVDCSNDERAPAWDALRRVGLASKDGRIFAAEGDAAVHFWTAGLADLPEDWDIIVPESLAGQEGGEAPPVLH